MRENSLRQRLQMVANANGSAHEEAVRTLTTTATDPASQDNDSNEGGVDALSLPALASGRTLRGGVVAEAEEGEAAEEEVVPPAEELTAQLHSVPCSKVVLAHAVPGTMVLTKTFIAFTSDDASPEYEKSLCMVSQ